ncbi:MAG: hypothetical protein ACRECY_05235 [Phyllobacterium sp.]
MRPVFALLLFGAMLSGALAGCTTPPRPAPAVQDPQRPEPATPGIKPLTVEQEEGGDE